MLQNHHKTTKSYHKITKIVTIICNIGGNFRSTSGDAAPQLRSNELAVTRTRWNLQWLQPLQAMVMIATRNVVSNCCSHRCNNNKKIPSRMCYQLLMVFCFAELPGHAITRCRFLKETVLILWNYFFSIYKACWCATVIGSIMLRVS